MQFSRDILKSEYKLYLEKNTSKRLRIILPVAIILLFFLVFSDIYIRKNTTATYTRILPVGLAIFLYLYDIFNPRASHYKTIFYNIFLALLPAMMFAKYIIHYGESTDTTSLTSIIVAIFIISLEIKEINLLKTILFFFTAPILFLISIFIFFPLIQESFIPLINIFIILISGLIINLVQNNFRYKTFLSNYLLNAEKKKLEDALHEINIYKDKLEEMVSEKTISLKKALEKAKESNMLKTQFLLNISHELRTPMNAILGFGDILAKKDNQYKKETEIINKNIKELLTKIENILLLSKLQTGQSGLEISKFKISDLNNKIKDYASKKIEENNKNIELIYENNINEEIILNSDFDKIFEILKQFIENAIKYTESGNIKISITDINSVKIKYTVSDTGLGIPPDSLPYIFDIFRKSENKNNFFGGTGIGLSIAKKSADLLNGKIEINSTPEKGTTAIFISDKNIKQIINS